jgi:two-component system, OmpR family, heavy metal sensor histidine kinase CusS
MFWKRPDSPGSLSARLSAWYAGSAFLLLLVATAFLYWVLLQSFDRENDQYLTEKVNTLATLLRGRDFRTVRWEVQGESTERPGVEVLSRVLSSEGGLVVESAGMSTRLPSIAMAEMGPTDYRAPGGKVFRILTRRVSGEYRVEVALEGTFEKNLLAQYRKQLWIVLGFGLVVCVLVGHGIARRGLRPVSEIAETVRRIRSTTLDERIDLSGLPSELNALAATFNEMLDRLEDAFARLARFSSDIAHELRTPINNLRGEVEVALARARSPEEYRDLLGSSLEECLRLSRLIDSLLFLARAENPGTEIRREPLQLAGEFSTVCEFYEAAASDAGVSLQSSAPETLTVALDRTLFQRAVGNLVENALAHTPPGGAIRLEARAEDGRVLVSVVDTGCGIPPDHLPRVFDRFHRVDPARSTHAGGAGLGLAIVKTIAALHGGRAEIESRPGQGTRVTLALPAAR